MINLARTTLANVKRLLALATLALAFFTLPGCEMFAWVAQAFDASTKPIYEISNLETAILVEDPRNYLGDPILKGVIANNIAFQLKDSDAVDKKRLVEAEAVAQLEKRLGPEFATKPIDEVGRLLHAKQIIHVYVEAASLNLEGGVMKPAMQLRVRLIDCMTGRRLFPKPEDSARQDAATIERGYGVMVSMPVRVSPDNSPSDASKAMEVLAIRTGKRIAWIFCEHNERQPGSGFSDKP